jgi:hypothetical protein
MNVYFSEILLKDVSPSCKVIYNKTDNSKYLIRLTNVKCPFGIEEFNKKIYLNVELKKDDYDHQTILKDIINIETYLLKDTNKEKISNIKNNVLFKLTIPQMRNKILAKCFKDKKEINFFDLKGTICDIIIEINSIWQFEAKTGVQFTVKTVNVIA